MKKTIGIYKITSPSGGIYIGQSTNIEGRKYFYKSAKCKSQFRIYNSIMKYGWDNHIFEIIEECTADLLNEREVYWIKKLNTFNSLHGMNLKDGGHNSKLSEESKRKISIGNKGKVRSAEFSENLSKMHKGKKLSKEHIEILKKANTGRKHTEEAKMRMKIAQNKPRPPITQETRNKLSLAAKKRVKDTDVISKMVAARNGAPSHSRKVIDNNTGIIYNSIKEASVVANKNYDHFKGCISGRKKNLTSFSYYNVY